jgi:hypothetical protein
LVLLAVAVGCSPGDRGPSDTGEVLAFTNVNVIPVEPEGVLSDQTVVVENGRVSEVGPAGEVKVPSGATVIAGEGRYLMPGLTDSHTHPMAEDDLIIFLANGITHIRSMWGEPSLLELRSRIERGEVTGPEISTSGRMVDGKDPIHFGTVELVDPARAAGLMRAQIDQGFDWIKIYSNMSLEVFDAVDAASAELGIQYAGHVPSAVSLEHALKSGMSSMEHLLGYGGAAQAEWVPISLEELFPNPETTAFFEKLGRGELDAGRMLDPDRLASIAEQTAKSDTWVVPTLVVLENVQGRGDKVPPEMRYLPPSVRAFWAGFAAMDAMYSADYHAGKAALFDKQLEIVEALHAAGAKILAGTDGPNPGVVPGFSLVEELELFMKAGFSTADAIRSATYDAAVFMGEEGERGHIAEGVAADLLLVDGNPLDDLAALKTPAGVVRAGTWHEGSELRAKLEELAAGYDRLEAQLNEAPQLEGMPYARADFMSADGGWLGVSVTRTEESTSVSAAIKTGDAWQSFGLIRSSSGHSLTGPSGSYDLSGNGEGWMLSRDGDAVAEHGDTGGPAVLLTGTQADLAVLHDHLSPIGVGAETSLQAWRCESALSCDRPVVEQWTVQRAPDTVLDGHFYYTGVRVFEVKHDDGSPLGVLHIGGGFYDGQPVAMELAGAEAMSAMKRVR